MEISERYCSSVGTRGGTVSRDTELQAEKSRVRMEFSIDSFWPQYGLGSTQPLTEMSTRNISWG